MKVYGLTTKDNPFDPIFQAWDWFVYDALHHNYNTAGLLARMSLESDLLSDETNQAIRNEAIDSIIKHVPDPNGQPYVKIVHDSSEKGLSDD